MTMTLESHGRGKGKRRVFIVDSKGRQQHLLGRLLALFLYQIGPKIGAAAGAVQHAPACNRTLISKLVFSVLSLLTFEIPFITDPGNYYLG